MYSILFQQTKPALVTKLTENDVLLGRGSRTLEHKGNVRFRKLIKKFKNDYSKAEKRSQKDAISREVVSIIISRNGRFLSKLDSKNGPHGPLKTDGAWVPAENETVLLKVKQAFRNCDDFSFDNDDDESDSESNSFQAPKNYSSTPNMPLAGTNTHVHPQKDLSSGAALSWFSRKTNSSLDENINLKQIPARIPFESSKPKRKLDCMHENETYEPGMNKRLCYSLDGDLPTSSAFGMTKTLFAAQSSVPADANVGNSQFPFLNMGVKAANPYFPSQRLNKAFGQLDDQQRLKRLVELQKMLQNEKRGYENTAVTSAGIGLHMREGIRQSLRAMALARQQSNAMEKYAIHKLQLSNGKMQPSPVEFRIANSRQTEV